MAATMQKRSNDDERSFRAASTMHISAAGMHCVACTESHPLRLPLPQPQPPSQNTAIVECKRVPFELM